MNLCPLTNEASKELLLRDILLEIHDSLVAIDAATRLAFSSHLRIGDFILAFSPIEKTVF